MKTLNFLAVSVALMGCGAQEISTRSQQSHPTIRDDGEAEAEEATEELALSPAAQQSFTGNLGGFEVSMLHKPNDTEMTLVRRKERLAVTGHLSVSFRPCDELYKGTLTNRRGELVHLEFSLPRRQQVREPVACALGMPQYNAVAVLKKMDGSKEKLMGNIVPKARR